MLTIHGVPLSVHTRKIIVTAILKKMDYRIEAVIPVIPDNPPANWSSLSPTGLIPVLQDGDYTLADSNAICLYLEKKQPAPADPAGRCPRVWPRAVVRCLCRRDDLPSRRASAFRADRRQSEHQQGAGGQGGDRQRPRARSSRRSWATSMARSTGNSSSATR